MFVDGILDALSMKAGGSKMHDDDTRSMWAQLRASYFGESSVLKAVHAAFYAASTAKIMERKIR